MIKFLLSLLFFLIGNNILAHNPSESFTTMHYDGKNLNVEVEFPWSLTNAVQQEYPEVQNATTEEFHRYVRKYLQKYFLLEQNHQLQKSSVIQFRDNEHGHSLIASFSYPLGSLKNVQLTNQLLLQWSDKQLNHHSLDIENQDKIEFTLHHERQSTSLSQANNDIPSPKKWPLLLPLSILVIGLIVWWNIAKSKN